MARPRETPSPIGPGPEARRQACILVIDDERLIRWSLKEKLEQEGYLVVEASDGASALAALDARVDLVLLDYRLPDTDGMALLAQVQRFDKDLPVIMMTAHSSVEHAVSAIKAGAHQYVVKPFELASVAITVARALETMSLRRELRTLQAKTEEGAAIIGESKLMLAVKRLIPRIAASPTSTVLITGESGTGKDLAAHALHALSERSKGPFVNITCSALPAALLESELFGHERGAFTDAKTRKDGLLWQANGGTVFLDEIGEMEIPLQAKLLRFLEEKTFRRVGGAEELTTDVRVVAATNTELKKAVTNGHFREDLYYRLAVLTVHLPPLREREGDVDLIAAHLIKRFNGEFGTNIRSLAHDAQRLLRTHPWPGNVRELRNAIERAVLLADGDALTLADFSFLRETAIDATVFTLPAGGIDLAELERSMVEQALERTGANQTQAAALIGMNRDRFRYRMQQYGLLPKASGS